MTKDALPSSLHVSLNNTPDPLADYDSLRAKCPIVHNAGLHWTVLRHADVTRILEDHQTFSNAVSTHLSVPNGMDPPEHTIYRAVVEKYFTPERMAAFTPVLQRLSIDLVGACHGEVDIVKMLSEPFSVKAQCAFMGWPDDLHAPLLQWIADNHQATRSGDRQQQTLVAQQFDSYIRAQLGIRRQSATNTQATDVTAELANERINGTPLSDAALVSLIRNWTVGELGTITACVSIICNFLANRPDIQALLRHNPQMRAAAIDEILRIQAPLPSNRRITTKPVEIGGQRLGAGERITLLWASANRDEAVFGPEADRFDLNRDPQQNLLYGKGIHMCPGAPLARLELGVLLDALLAGTSHIGAVANKPPIKARYPSAGYSTLILQFDPA